MCGVPVVAAASGGLGEVVVDGVTGRTFPPGDAAALARVVGELVADPQQAARLAEAGRRAAQRFGLGPATRAYAELYQRLLTGHHPPR